jgi:hypothetical protein
MPYTLKVKKGDQVSRFCFGSKDLFENIHNAFNNNKNNNEILFMTYKDEDDDLIYITNQMEYDAMLVYYKIFQKDWIQTKVAHVDLKLNHNNNIDVDISLLSIGKLRTSDYLSNNNIDQTSVICQNSLMNNNKNIETLDSKKLLKNSDILNIKKLKNTLERFGWKVKKIDSLKNEIYESQCENEDGHKNEIYIAPKERNFIYCIEFESSGSLNILEKYLDSFGWVIKKVKIMLENENKNEINNNNNKDDKNNNENEINNTIEDSIINIQNKEENVIMDRYEDENEVVLIDGKDGIWNVESSDDDGDEKNDIWDIAPLDEGELFLLNIGKSKFNTSFSCGEGKNINFDEAVGMISEICDVTIVKAKKILRNSYTYDLNKIIRNTVHGNL